MWFKGCDVAHVVSASLAAVLRAAAASLVEVCSAPAAAAASSRQGRLPSIMVVGIVLPTSEAPEAQSSKPPETQSS